jgi:DNA repair protein RadC
LALKAKEGNMTRSTQVDRQLRYGLPELKLYLKPRPRLKKTLRISTPQEAVDLLRPLRYAAEEHFVALHLNAKHEVIGVHEVSHGTLSASLVHPREVYKAALLANSFAILVCHNHPSGSLLTPSQEDIATTEQLLEAGELLGVNLIDHLIVGPRADEGDCHSFFSFRENHPRLWTNCRT